MFLKACYRKFRRLLRRRPRQTPAVYRPRPESLREVLQQMRESADEQTEAKMSPPPGLSMEEVLLRRRAAMRRQGLDHPDPRLPMSPAEWAAAMRRQVLDHPDPRLPMSPAEWAAAALQTAADRRVDELNRLEAMMWAPADRTPERLPDAVASALNAGDPVVVDEMWFGPTIATLAERLKAPRDEYAAQAGPTLPTGPNPRA